MLLSSAWSYSWFRIEDSINPIESLAALICRHPVQRYAATSDVTLHRYLHENYNAIIGDDDDVTNSDAFYHWGALLGLIGWTEDVSPPHSAH